MKTALLPGLAATGYLLSSATAAVHVPIVKNHHVQADQLQAAQLRRRGTVTESLGNAQQFGLYYANITAGTPAQDLSLQIDTGSSDVWLPSSTARLCRSRQGCEGGSCKLALIQKQALFAAVADGCCKQLIRPHHQHFRLLDKTSLIFRMSTGLGLQEATSPTHLALEGRKFKILRWALGRRLRFQLGSCKSCTFVGAGTGSI